MTTVSVCGPAPNCIHTSHGEMWLYPAVYLPEVDHVMATDDTSSGYYLVYYPRGHRVLALARVNERGSWTIRPVVHEENNAVLSRYGGVSQCSSIPDALETMWASWRRQVEAA